MTKKKWVAVLSTLALLAAACGESSPTETTDTPAEPPTLEGVSLQLMGWSSSPSEDEALAALIEQFNDETGANATFNPVPEYDATLGAALAGGEPPDVFYVDSFRLPDLVAAGALQAVPSGMISDPDDIFQSLRDAFTFDGTWYCPPKDFSTLALVYDTDAFEEADVEPPTTWEELREAAETLTTEDRAGLTMGVEYPRWAVFLFQAGASLTDDAVSEITIGTPEARQALDFVADLYQSGLAVNPADVDAGWAGEAFGQGKAAMTIEGNWIVGFLEDSFPEKNWAVAELPVGPAGPGTFAFTVCYGVAADATNPEASWALVEYLTNAEGSLAWTSAFNVMPARESVTAQWLSDRPQLEAFVAGAEYANRWQFRPGFGDVVGAFADRAQAIVAGTGSVEGLINQVELAGASVLD